jgi:hypothetical protein
MSNRTWACVACGKAYRRDYSVPSVTCAICGQPCESVHHKVRIPSPRKRKEWDRFWEKYIAEKKKLAEYYAGGRKGPLTLEILGLKFH